VLRDIYPVQWAGRRAVVTLPEHIDVYNAGPIREELLSVINHGAEVLIVEMSATISCDHAGADAVGRASQRAALSGTKLRLVVTAQIVSRVLSLGGLDRLVPIYPSLEAAISASRAPAAVSALVPASAGPGTDQRTPSRPARQRRAEVPAAWRSDENGPVIPAAAVTGAPRLEDLADQARAAVTAEQEQCDSELFDTVTASLFHAALNLQAAMDLPVDAARQHVSAALGYLDGTIREIRDAAFTARGHETALSTPADGGTGVMRPTDS
jgi:anti-sigma B factor antagonist